MIKRVALIVSFSVFSLFGQGIQLTGTVKDSATGAVLSGVKVVLMKARVSATTDDKGAFAFNTSTSVKSAIERHEQSVSYTPGSFLFRFDAQKKVSLTIISLNGRTVYQAQKTIGPGSQKLTLPVQNNGVFLYKLETGTETFLFKQVNTGSGVTGRRILKSESNPGAGIMGKLAAATVDTLRAYRTGYLSTALPLSAYTASGLTINLKKKDVYDTNMVMPDPDTKPVATGKPMKVFILLGQSNMIGYGQIEPDTTKGTLAYYVKKQNKYPHTIGADGKWTVRNDVWDVNTLAGIRQGFHTVGFGNGTSRIGPEYQFGHIMGYVHDEMVLIVKASMGNRGLGWDLLPPGSQRYTYQGTVYAGYGDSTKSWPVGASQRIIDSLKTKMWYAGKQYDDFNTAVHGVLNNLPKYYPGYSAADGYEIAGFGWFQGHWDQPMAYATRYEQNLVQLIKELRKEFKAPNAKFVCATIAFDGYNLTQPGWLLVQKAQLAVSGDAGNYPEFYGNTKTVDARGYWRDLSVSPSGQGYHYHWNAETYYLVGNAMGWAMADLLKK